MKKFTKVVLGMMLAVTFGAVLGSNTADANERSFGDVYNRKMVTIRSAMNTTRLVGLHETDVNQILLRNSGNSWTDEWESWYQEATDTYIFRKFGVKHGRILPIYLGVTDSKDANGNNLIGSILTDTEGRAQPWRLIPVGSHPDGIIFLFENISQEGKVLDIPDSNTTQENLITFPRHGRANQQFIVQVLRNRN